MGSKYKKTVCKCQRCNKPFKTYFGEETLCKSCRNLKEEEELKALTGQTIPKVMTRTSRDAAFSQTRPVLVASAKFEAEQNAKENFENSPAMTVVCKDCGEEFTITNGEKQWYESKGLCLPVRCHECRNKRKQEKANAQGNSRI